MPYDVIMPSLGAVSSDSTLLRWLVKPGDNVESGQVLFEAESDKAVVEIQAGASGVMGKLLVEPGDVVPNGQVIARIYHSGESANQPAEVPVETLPPDTNTQVKDASPSSTQTLLRRSITPLARILARAEGIDFSVVSGSGPHGRIVQSDILNAIHQRNQSQRITEMEANAVERDAPINEPTIILRRRIAQAMSESVHATAPVTLTTETTADELVTLREILIKDAGSGAPAIPYDLLLAIIVARALENYPDLNASWVEGNIVQHHDINIGIAVDTERGLMVPVLKNIPHRSLLNLAREFEDVVARARAGKSIPDDFNQGTFTITNLGMYGVDAFTPIIHLPECAVLGVGRIKRKPVERNGELALGYVLSLSLTFDHRVVDGAPAARFLMRVSSLIAEPRLLLLR